MAVANGTFVGTAIAGGTIGMVTTNNTTTASPYYNGYNVASDTIFGVPSYEWHKLSSMEQRYYAERWNERERDRSLYDAQRKQNQMLREMMDQGIPEAPKMSKAPEPSFTSNKLLLLEN